MVQKMLGIKQDGLFGSLTKQGLIKLIQKTVGSAIDGYWGPKTAANMRTLKSGSTGWDVYAIQAFLLGNNFQIVGMPDNTFGPNTVRAVKEFQIVSGLQSDGIVGPKTCQKLVV